MPEVKPLRWQFYLSVPIVLVAIWGVFYVLACLQRWQFTNELSQCVAAGSVEDATDAVGRLARLPKPPLETIVAAATSSSRDVALQAQSAIAELLVKWRRNVNQGRDTRSIARQLERLAAELDARCGTFIAADHAWLAKTAEQIVRLANCAALSDGPTLAKHCEAMLSLAAAPAVGARGELIPVTSEVIESAPAKIFSHPSRVALESILPAELSREHPSALGIGHPNARPQPAARTRLQWQRPDDESRDYSAPRQFHPRHTTEFELTHPNAADEFSLSTPRPVRPWKSIHSRALLGHWLTATGGTKTEIERELSCRGFGFLRTDVVRLALSGSSNARVQLVHDLLDTPAIGTKAWLLLLADDPDAEVRYATVNLMATSHDAELIDKAWQMALHDQDPRIAGLAERLRGRQLDSARH